MSTTQIDKSSSIINQTRSSQNTIKPSTTSLTDQMKTFSVSSTAPIPTTISSRPVSNTSYLNEYEIVDTSTQSIKKPLTNIASFPPRQNASLFNSITLTNDKPISTFNNTSKSNSTNGNYSSSLLNDHSRLQTKTNVNNKTESINSQQRDTPISTYSNEGSIRFGNTSGQQTTPVTPSL
jgi:hypothetical protein